MEVILDTNVWFAYLHDADSQHEKALSLFDVLKDRVLIPEYVLIEILNLITVKIGKADADNFIADLLSFDKVSILWSTSDFRDELLSFFLSNKIEKLSFVDQSLLFLSKKYRVVTFDKVLDKHIAR